MSSKRVTKNDSKFQNSHKLSKPGRKAAEIKRENSLSKALPAHGNHSIIHSNPKPESKNIMKTKSLILGVGAAGALLTSSAYAQSAVSDPVGYITVDVAGGDGSTAAISLVSPTLLTAPEFTGAVASAAGTVITVDGALTAGAFTSGGTFYVEVTTGGTTGVFADITANDAGTITTAEDISAAATAGATITVRQHITLDQFLGAANEAGLTDGGTAAAADSVTVFDATTQVGTAYFFLSGTGWFDTNFAPSGDAIIGPEQGLIVARRGADDVSFTSVGHVKVNQANLPVVSGLNVVGVPNAVGTTLGASGLSDGLAAGSTAAEADNVTTFVDGVSTTYFFLTGTGWFDTAFGASDDVPLPEGSSILITRRGADATSWDAPAPTIN